ncbi:hypothetical protein BLNAU_13161 [Blattamonas nauphoetae]|uniref:IPO4/5-like TPR repeats domain-containing protein n=1 Tax=Blattamonas nauphoetae TaxID=2049346 RepID=A0ABQ9XM89_9EUKA|nr:hypothetical protein BLNAU_13161 [Blattamonas nauphoetae]
MDLQQFYLLLNDTTQPNTEIVKHAQDTLAGLYNQNPSLYATLCINALQTSSDEKILSTVFTRLRYNLMTSPAYPSLLELISPELVENLKNSLISILFNPNTPSSSRRLCASIITEFGQAAFELLRSNDEMFRPYAQQFAQLILNTLAETKPQTSQLKAVALLSAFLQVFPKDPSLIEPLRQTIPSVIRLLTQCLNQGQEDDCVEILKSLISIVEGRPTFFGDALMETILPGMFVIVANPSVSLVKPSVSPNKAHLFQTDYVKSPHHLSVRLLCLDFISVAVTGIDDKVRTTFCKSLLKMAKDGSVLERFLTLFLTTVATFMLEFEEEEDENCWLNPTDEVKIDYHESLIGRCFSYLNRMSTAVKAKHFFPLFAQLVGQLLTFGDGMNPPCPTAYRHHVVGNFIIGACIEGVVDSLKNPSDLQNLLQLVSRSFALYPNPLPGRNGAQLLPYPNQIEVYSAINAISHMVDNLGNYFFKPFAGTLQQYLLAGLSSCSCRNVQINTSLCLINIFSQTSKYLKPLCVPIAEQITEILTVELSQPPRDVENQYNLRNIALGSLIYILDSSGDNAADMLPFLFSALSGIVEMPNITTSVDRQFQGRAAQALASLLVSAGSASEPYLDKYVEIMSSLSRQIGTDPKSQNDERMQYVKQSWLKMSELLKERFVHVLDIVLPPLLQSASRTGDSIHAEIKDQYTEILQEDGMVITTGENALVAREDAFSNLSTYAETLGQHFAPYVQSCLDVCMEALRDGVPETVFTQQAEEQRGTDDAETRRYLITSTPVAAIVSLIAECLVSLSLAIVDKHHPAAFNRRKEDDGQESFLPAALQDPLPLEILSRPLSDLAQEAGVVNPMTVLQSFQPYILYLCSLDFVEYQEKCAMLDSFRNMMYAFSPFISSQVHFPPLPYPREQTIGEPQMFFDIAQIVSFIKSQLILTVQYRTKALSDHNLDGLEIQEAEDDFGAVELDAQDDAEAAGQYFSELVGLSETLFELYRQYYTPHMLTLFPSFMLQLSPNESEKQLYRDADDRTSALYALALMILFGGDQSYAMLPQLAPIFISFVQACATDYMEKTESRRDRGQKVKTRQKKQAAMSAGSSLLIISSAETSTWQNASYGLGMAVEKDMEWMKWLLLNKEATPLQIVSSFFTQSQTPTAMSTSFPNLPLGSLFFPYLQQSIEALTGCIRISGKDDHSFLKAHETAVSALSKVLRWLELVQALFEAVINRKREIQPHLISLPPATSQHFIPFLLRKQETPLMDDPEVNDQHIQSVTAQLALLQQQRQHLLAVWSKQLPLLVDEEEAVCCHNMLTMYAKEGNPIVLASGELEGDIQCGMLIAQALNGTLSGPLPEVAFPYFRRIVSILMQIIRSSHASEASSPILEEMLQKLSSYLPQEVLQTLWSEQSEERQEILNNFFNLTN